ncbi:unnamed protein product (macronuclear) [Paramecium tetraurelia]|uniref:Histidine phosphatase family protein n=1 Tax=Paramecium tetraurelia TaxID=5888 RepID=A0CTD5_PARTE|nr:uncharacterized protein GSPATT00010286001 [Paramecium tetraurelia]CAK74052.1 unnamed protein product [Paramecium tetraurelia]|eukprot:XP_001441449.1 hypothetical protein (macronuclear) [Paramecium tetraurelia strain d4-2]
MINLYVFRHGQSIYQCLRVISGLHEFGLSALGKYQTYNLASRTDVDFEIAYISDTKRTIETFEMLKLAGKMPSEENCVFTPLIREKCQGDFIMQEFKAFPDDPNKRNFTPKNGESWEDVQVRVSKTFDFLVRRYLLQQKEAKQDDDELVKALFQQSEHIESKKNNIILVTHYGFIKEIVQYLKKADQLQLEQPYFAQNATLFTLQLFLKENESWQAKIISLNSYTRQYRPFMD